MDDTAAYVAELETYLLAAGNLDYDDNIDPRGRALASSGYPGGPDRADADRGPGGPQWS